MNLKIGKKIIMWFITIGTLANGYGTSFFSQEKRYFKICLQNDEQITPLEEKLQITLKGLWDTFSKTNRSDIENCALKLVKIKITISNLKSTIQEALLMLIICADQDRYQEEMEQLFSNRIDAKDSDAKGSLEINCELAGHWKQYPQNQDELLKILAERLGRVIVFLKVTSGARFNSELFTNFFEELKIYRSEKEPFVFISCKQDLKDNKIQAILSNNNLGGLEENDTLAANKTGKREQNILKISVPNWMEDWSNNPDGIIFLVGDYNDDSLYLLQVAPALTTEVSIPKKIIYALYNHKKTIAEIAIIALLAYAYGSNAYGVRTILTQKGDEVLSFLKESKEKITDFLKESKEKVVNYAHGKGFKSNRQLDSERSILEKIGGGIGWAVGGVAGGIKEIFVGGWKGLKKGLSN